MNFLLLLAVVFNAASAAPIDFPSSNFNLPNILKRLNCFGACQIPKNPTITEGLNTNLAKFEKTKSELIHSLADERAAAKPNLESDAEAAKRVVPPNGNEHLQKELTNFKTSSARPVTVSTSLGDFVEELNPIIAEMENTYRQLASGPVSWQTIDKAHAERMSTYLRAIEIIERANDVQLQAELKALIRPQHTKVIELLNKLNDELWEEGLKLRVDSLGVLLKINDEYAKVLLEAENELYTSFIGMRNLLKKIEKSQSYDVWNAEVFEMYYKEHEDALRARTKAANDILEAAKEKVVSEQEMNLIETAHKHLIENNPYQVLLEMEHGDTFKKMESIINEKSKN